MAALEKSSVQGDPPSHASSADPQASGPVTDAASALAALMAIVSESTPDAVVKRVGMLRAGMLDPRMAQYLTVVPPEKFSGKDKDWPSFCRRWNRFAQQLNAIAPMDDLTKLQNLEGLLDETSLTQLEKEWVNDPQLSFDKFWTFLSRRHSRDLEDTFMQQLDRLSVAHMEPLTVDALRHYRAKFKLLASQVGELSPYEKFKKFGVGLPVQWRRSLMEEETRKSERESWIKTKNPVHWQWWKSKGGWHK